ncbi:MAG: hypothetical protein ACKVWR_08920 [Acidimicrobiales bacterium]
MTAQFVLSAAVKPGRMGDAAKWAAKAKRLCAQHGGTLRIFSLLPGGDQAGSVMITVEFANNAALGAFLDAGVGNDRELTLATMETLGESSPFTDHNNYVLQEIPLR